VREITITKGYTTQVDDEESERANQHPWSASIKRRADGSIKNVYAVRNIIKNGKHTTQKLHRFIMGGDDPKVEVDHQNHNGLDNQRHNLRVSTRTQNSGNAIKSVQPKSSRFKNVYLDSAREKWVAKVMQDGKHKFLGRFATEEAAVHRADEAARNIFGEFAHPNF